MRLERKERKLQKKEVQTLYQLKHSLHHFFTHLTIPRKTILTLVMSLSLIQGNLLKGQERHLSQERLAAKQEIVSEKKLLTNVEDDMQEFRKKIYILLEHNRHFEAIQAISALMDSLHAQSQLLHEYADFTAMYNELDALLKYTLNHVAVTAVKKHLSQGFYQLDGEIVYVAHVSSRGNASDVAAETTAELLSMARKEFGSGRQMQIHARNITETISTTTLENGNQVAVVWITTKSIVYRVDGQSHTLYLHPNNFKSF